MKRVLTSPSTCVEQTQDNAEGNLVVCKGDYIVKTEDFKYMVVDILGVGTFGQVFRCISCEGDEVAIKVVKSINKYFQYEMNEVRMLNRLKERNLTNIFVEIQDAFVYKQHLCIVVELLGKSMYDLTKIFKYNGMGYPYLKSILHQVLVGLHELHGLGIVHCDLKPENILVSDYFTSKVKIIDFGSSTSRPLSSVFYVQSRFYRAPEVILGIPYGSSIDMWSFGCLAYELFTGKPLFPGKDNKDQIMKIHGFYPNGLPHFMLEHGLNTGLYFDRGEYYDVLNNPNRFTIQSMVDSVYSKFGSKQEHEVFIDMLMQALNPSYLERTLPRTLLKHDFFNFSSPDNSEMDQLRFGKRKTPKRDTNPRKMSMYDFGFFDMSKDDGFGRKGSLFDPEYENRKNKKF